LMGLALAISYLVVKRNLWVLVLAHAYIDSLLGQTRYVPRVSELRQEDRSYFWRQPNSPW
jgi:hypothetical protein